MLKLVCDVSKYIADAADNLDKLHIFIDCFVAGKRLIASDSDFFL